MNYGIPEEHHGKHGMINFLLNMEDSKHGVCF